MMKQICGSPVQKEAYSGQVYWVVWHLLQLQLSHWHAIHASTPSWSVLLFLEHWLPVASWFGRAIIFSYTIAMIGAGVALALSLSFM